MGATQFNSNGNQTAKNYQLRKLDNGAMIFATDCEAGTPGAIPMVRQKDGKNHKAGDPFFVTGGNAFNGVIKGMWIRPGFAGGATKQLNIGFASFDEAGNVQREFVKLSLVDEKGRINSDTARLLAAIEKADLGEPVTLAIHTFHHKAGEKMGENTDKVWEKDGTSTMLSVYQDHLATADNERGRIILEKADYYTQPSFYMKSKDAIDITPGTKAPEGAVVIYDADSAGAFAARVVENVMSRVVKDDKLTQAAEAEHAGDTAFGEGDTAFGEDQHASRGPRP